MKLRAPWRSEARSRGAALLLVVLLVFVLMALAGLVVDLGISRATQIYLQAGADVAAVEGLRARDAILGDPTQADLARRTAASRAAALVFDEDLDLDTAAEELLLGAGPQLSTGVLSVAAPAGGVLVSDGPYLPLLELNDASNEVHGDLVAGTFTALDPLDPGDPFWHLEDGFYQRNDFEAADVPDAPGANAFLARLRRTNDPIGLDVQPGVSSSGPTLPYLFALGSALTTDDPNVYDPRRDGITVRGTAIADARPVLSAGVMNALVNGVALVGADAVDPTLPRLLAFDEALWETAFTTAGPFSVDVYADGTIVGTDGGATPAAAGRAWPGPGPLSVGAAIDAAVVPGAVLLPPAAPGIEGVRYVALYGALPPSSLRLTGFASVSIESAVPATDGDGVAVLRVAGRKLPSLIAPENASAVPALAQDPTALTAAGPLREPLLAPVLAR